MNKKELSKYKKYLETEAEKFRLTQEDLSNLTDLGMMIPAWFVKDVLKPNKMDKWFWKFFRRIEDITLPELKERK
jgi:hypothetical protein